MAMVARKLFPARHAMVLPPGLYRSRSAHAPPLPTSSSVSISNVRCTSSHQTRSPACATSRAYSVVRGTIPAAVEQSKEGSPSVVRACGGSDRSSIPASGSSVRRNLRCSGSFQQDDWAAGDRQNQTRAVLARGGHASWTGSVGSSRTRRGRRFAQGDPLLLQVAGFRTTASVSGASSDAGAGGSSSSSSSSSSGGGGSGKTQTPAGAVGSSSGQDGREGPLSSPQVESSEAAAAAGERKYQEPPKSAASIGDERITVKGGNPAVRGGQGTFIEIRSRMRHARLDAREDAKDWMRDKRDDMNTMKETLRDAHQDGRLRKELSDQAKESSGRLQVLWRQYGVVGIGTYFGIYFGSIAVLYVIYDYGVLTNLPSGGTAVIEHMQEWMKHTPEWSQAYSESLFGAMKEDHRARSFVLAWATCKVLEPVRLLGAIAATPRLARALGRAPAKTVAGSDDGDNGSDEDGGKADRDEWESRNKWRAFPPKEKAGAGVGENAGSGGGGGGGGGGGEDDGRGAR